MKSKAAIAAEIKISLWEPKFEELKKQMKESGPSSWLAMRLRGDLRVYGTLIAFAKDDLSLEDGYRSEARDQARAQYLDASETSSAAWLKYADGTGDPFADSEVDTLERATDEALYAWVDA